MRTLWIRSSKALLWHFAKSGEIITVGSGHPLDHADVAHPSKLA